MVVFKELLAKKKKQLCITQFLVKSVLKNFKETGQVGGQKMNIQA